MLNSRGQIGDTLTWFIATIIIIVILLLSILVSSYFGISEKRKIGHTNFLDPIIQKSVFAFLLTPLPSSLLVFDDLSIKGEISGESDSLAKNIFSKNADNFFYSVLYSVEDLGVLIEIGNLIPGQTSVAKKDIFAAIFLRYYLNSEKVFKITTITKLEDISASSFNPF